MLLPTHEQKRTSYREPSPVFRGLDSLVHTCIGFYKRWFDATHRLDLLATRIHALAPQYVELSDGALQQALLAFREQVRRNGSVPDQLLAPALAAIREASDRQLGLRPFHVQLMGTLALHRGFLAEMATGEGKTLTAGLAAVLAGWTRRPCHIITVNDYLVERDAEWLRPLYRFCGIRVGSVTAASDHAQRQKAYDCDVTYTTSKELLADFLRDRLRLAGLAHPTRRLIRRMLAPQSAPADGLMLRGLHTAIVDEADSLLIDEAVTPLIISAPHKNELLKEAGRAARQIVAQLKAGDDYRTDLRYKEIEVTETGLHKLVQSAAQLPGLWRSKERRLELIRQALVAREFYQRDKHYIIEGGKIVIVDEFTGRPMAQRTWREGMHQAIEAKEDLPISDPSETVARLSFQRFFRCFFRLSGMTGTAREAARELWQVYQLPVVRIPTNRPCLRQHWPDRFFVDEESKSREVVHAIEQMHRTGRPLLVGTRSVLASERLAILLAERGLDCKVLNATRLKEEAEIVALAGESGHITIATNMAGRGTDIKLGAGVSRVGGLHVIATERHESGRVDRQLFGRSARQGDPGSAQAFVSAEDELIRRYLPRPVREALPLVLKSNLPGKVMLAHQAFALAQRTAQGLAFKQRCSVLRSDSWLEEALSFAGQNVV